MARSLLGSMALVLAVPFLGGCPEPELLLAVDAKSDFQPGIEFTGVEVTVSHDTVVPTGGRFSLAARRGEDYVVGQRIAELGLAASSYTLRVRLVAPDGSVRAEKVTEISLTQSTVLTVVLARSPNVCMTAASDCPPSAVTCVEAMCVEEACFYLGRNDRCAMGEWCNPDTGCELLPVEPDAGPAAMDAGRRDSGPGCTCAGIECGPDSCGMGSCGGCAMDQSCSGGHCTTNPPDCSGLSCGPARNGIGGPDACGTCSAPSTCSGGSCVCTPDCSGLSCGNDRNCGTSCGSCGAGTYCSGGNCICGGALTACSGSEPCCGGLDCMGVCCTPNGGGCSDGSTCCNDPDGTDNVCDGGECCHPVRTGCVAGAGQCCPGRGCVDGVCCVALFDGCAADDQCCNFFSANVGCRSGRCCWTAGHGCVAASAGNCCDGTCSGGVC